MSVSLSSEEIARRGQELYERDILPNVEEPYRGQFLVLDVLTGDYEIAERDVIASNRILARHPNGLLYGVGIGSPVAYRLGGHSTVTSP